MAVAWGQMKLTVTIGLIAIVPFAVLLGQPVLPGRQITIPFTAAVPDCQSVEALARSYLQSRGFSTAEDCANCQRLRSSKDLLDASGRLISTQRIRRDFSNHVPFFIWSSPLHAFVSIFANPTAQSGCNLRLDIGFNSLHRMVVGIIPVNEVMQLGSNGRLELEYLEAIRIRADGNLERERPSGAK
jgi:hypothetical protein